jgi:hypothetical protein
MVGQRKASTQNWGSKWSSKWGWGSGDGSWSNMVGKGNSWGSYGVSNLSGLGEGACLVDGLFVGDFSSDWSNDGFSSKYRMFSKNRASAKGLGNDWSWLNSSDGSWGMDMGVFSNGDGLVCNFWYNLGKSFSSSDSVGEVASQSVMAE